MCFQEPIIGYRYKCSVCNNYNICEKCEEVNLQTEEHPHDFIKIKKQNNNNKDNNEINEKDNKKNHKNDNQKYNQKDDKKDKQKNDKKEEKKENDLKNNINKNINKEKKVNNENKEYSYDCINIISLISYIYEGTEEAKFDIILKNNGKDDWPKGTTKLIFDNNSQFSGDDIVLSPQVPGEEKKYKVVVKDLERNEPGEYKSFLNFNVNEQNYGEKLTLRIHIKEEKKDNELNDKKKVIDEFRNTFGLSEEEFSDEKMLEKLKENDFNFEKTFDALFN